MAHDRYTIRVKRIDLRSSLILPSGSNHNLEKKKIKKGGHINASDTGCERDDRVY